MEAIPQCIVRALLTVTDPTYIPPAPMSIYLIVGGRLQHVIYDDMRPAGPPPV